MNEKMHAMDRRIEELGRKVGGCVATDSMRTPMEYSMQPQARLKDVTLHMQAPGAEDPILRAMTPEFITPNWT